MRKLVILFVALFLVIPNAVSAEEYFSVNLSAGSKKKVEIQKLQEFLTDEGYYKGPISGYYFSLTQKAVLNFKKKNKIKPYNNIWDKKARKKASQILIEKYPAEDEVLEISEKIKQPQDQILSTSQSVKQSEPAKLLTGDDLKKQLEKQSKTNGDFNIEKAKPVATESAKQEQVSQSSSVPKIDNVTFTSDAEVFRIKWSTDRITSGKVFLTVGADTKIATSLSGNSTNHMVEIGGLSSGVVYSYQIEAVDTQGIFAKKFGTTSTTLKPPYERSQILKPLIIEPNYKSVSFSVQKNTTFEFEGKKYELADGASTQIKGLGAGQEYKVTWTYHEEGRQDSVFIEIFKTRTIEQGISCRFENGTILNINKPFFASFQSTNESPFGMYLSCGASTMMDSVVHSIDVIITNNFDTVQTLTRVDSKVGISDKKNELLFTKLNPGEQIIKTVQIEKKGDFNFSIGAMFELSSTGFEKTAPSLTFEVANLKMTNEIEGIDFVVMKK